MTMCPEIDLEMLCIAFGWAYGTEVERENMQREPDDGMTPETLWANADDESREFTRRVMRQTLTTAGIPFRDGEHVDRKSEG